MEFSENIVLGGSKKEYCEYRGPLQEFHVEYMIF